MAITATDRGTHQTTAGTSGVTKTSSSLSPATGSMYVVATFYNANGSPASGTGDDVTMTVSDTSLGLTWTRRAFSTRGGGLAASGAYRENVEIWTSSTVSGTPTGTITLSSNATVGNNDGWLGFKVWEITGQDASPIGLTVSGTPTSSTSTYTLDFGATPASDSWVVGVIHDDNQVGPAVTPPSGWTEADEQAPGWGAITEWATKNGGASQTAQWSGFTNSSTVRMLGAGIEIKAAAGATNAAAGNASSAATAYQATAEVATAAGNPTSAAVAYTATASVSPAAGNATGAAVAYGPSAEVSAFAGVATVGATAEQPTATTSSTTDATAGTATAAVAAEQPTIVVDAQAGVATVGAAAEQPTAQTSSATQADAGAATATVAAFDVAVTVATPAGLATSSGAALAPTAEVAPALAAPAVAATAYAVSVVVSVVVGTATVGASAVSATAGAVIYPSVGYADVFVRAVADTRPFVIANARASALVRQN